MILLMSILWLIVSKALLMSSVTSTVLSGGLWLSPVVMVLVIL